MLPAFAYTIDPLKAAGSGRTTVGGAGVIAGPGGPVVLFELVLRKGIWPFINPSVAAAITRSTTAAAMGPTCVAIGPRPYGSRSGFGPAGRRGPGRPPEKPAGGGPPLPGPRPG